MRMQMNLPLVLARALFARDEGFERTLPARQICPVEWITVFPGVR